MLRETVYIACERRKSVDVVDVKVSNSNSPG